MRRSLLNKRILPKPLRQALVLFTLLLLPSAAWGQWDTMTFNFDGCNENSILYASDSEGSSTSYVWNYQGASGIGLNEEKVKISVSSGSLKNILTPPDGYTIKQVTLNYSNLEITDASESSKIYVRAVNRNDSANIHYSDPYFFSGTSGETSINLNTEKGIPSNDLMFLIFSNDNKAFSFVLNSITITKIADYHISIGGVPLTGANVNTETGAVTDMSGISFTPANTENGTPATLTLNNANYGPSLKGIIWSGNGNLKIQYSGNNIINTRNGNELNAGSKDGYCIFGNGSSDLILSASDQASTLTLKPSYGGSTESNSRAAISGFENVTLDSGWGMYYTDDYLAATATSLTAGKEVIICKGQPYGISVGGVPVTSANINDVLNDGGTVKFKLATLSPDGGQTPDTPATLTLDGATISGNIESGITPLAVYLKGSSTITPSNTSDAPFQYTGTESTATLTFESSEADKGSLTMNGISSIDYISGGYTIDGKNDWAHSGNYTDPDWIKEEYSTPGNKVVIWRNTQYDLQVGSYHVAESNKNQLEAFSFDSDTYTLSPISSSFDGNIISGLSKLTIEVPGKYTITGTISAKEGTDSKLEIKAGDTDMVHSLTVKNENGAIVGFSDVIITSPMKLVTPATDQPTWNVSTTEVVISDEVFYDLWVGGVHVSSGNASDIFEDKEDPDDLATASFNKTTNTLTLNGASIEVDGKNAIESGLATLNVIISGTNNIIYQGTETVAFKGIGTDNAIAFKLDTSNPGEIDIQCSNNSIIDGLKVEYEDGIGLIAIESNYYSIGKLLKPEIKSSVSEDGISVALILPSGESYIGSTMYYSITYNDEEVEDTPYDNAFTMSKPGTVTAYLVPSLGGRSGNSVGKYYGYPDAPYTMGVGDEITPAIYPAIEDNDYIGLNGSTSSNENIATFTYSDGVVKALATGTVTLTAILTGSDMSFTVLNPKESSEPSNSNYPVTFSVIVGENLNTIFAANQNFGTWYNTSDKTYKVPDGITAYIITGVDGDKVTIAETKVIPPNAPILMEKGENAKAFTYTEATDTDGSFPSGNILNYTTTDKEAVEASKLYVLYNGQFVKVTAGTKILANHCYLDLGGTSAGTRGFYNIGDGEGTTAIREVIYEGVNSEKLADGAWHDLQGRKFTTKPTKAGIYIRNGKKIVIK